MMCKRIFASQTAPTGDVPFYKIGTMGSSPDAYISFSLYNEYKRQYSFPLPGETLITCSGTVGRCVRYDGAPAYYQDSNIVWMRNKTNIISKGFLFWLLKKHDWSTLNKTTISRIYSSDLLGLTLNYPESRLEQDRISKFFDLIERRIELQSKIIEGFQRQKKILRNAVFSNVRGAERPISEIVAYEQPSRYIVSSDDYSADASLTPVLTANKGFILGYTADKEGIYHRGDAVILDDFTLDMKYVDFPFKVKSSAIKILTCNDKFTLRYIYEYLCYLNLNSSEHKRHYISEIAPMEIVLPAAKAIETIACLFEKMDQRVVREQRIQELLVSQKQFLLSTMFI